MIRIRGLVIATALLAQAAHADESALKVVGALGDSITVAVNASRIGSDLKHSWVTGDAAEFSSHFNRLVAEHGRGLIAANEAVSGARAKDLHAQADKLVRAEPDYVTVLIGANDLCAWTADHARALEQFTTDVRTVLQKLVRARPDIRILLSGIPDMNHLQAVGAANGCESKWSLFRICQSLLGRDRTTPERAAFRERWQDANTALAQIASGMPQNVKYLDAVTTTHFELADLSSIDCFHPSVAGQKKLADVSYATGWFE